MGKKSDGASIHSRMLLGGYDRELERYGVEGPRHGRTDRGGDGYRSAEDVEKDLIAAARNDYDLRRTVEAAAMSGKKKAIKLQKKGFKSIDDITNWGNFSEKAAKRHGQGGDFSSASDYMGLTRSMVERDRRKQTEGYNKDFALGADLAALKEEMNGRFDEQAENVTPSTLAEDPPAEKPTDDYELNLGGTGTDIFGGGSPQEQEQAEYFKTNAVANVKKGIQLSNVETRGPQSGVRPGAGF